MAVGSLLTVVHQLAEVAVPVVIGVTIDRAIATGDGAAMARWTVVLAGLFAVLSFAGCVGLYVEERAVTGTTHRMRLAVARRVLDPGGGVEDALPGQVVSLSTVETARIGEGVGAVILGVGALAGTIAATVLLLTTSLSLGLVVVVGLPALLVAVQVLSRPLTARAEAQQEAVGSAAGVAADLFSGLRVLKGLGAEASAADRYRRASGNALGAALDANRVRAAYLGVTLTAAGGFLALVTWIGGRQALAGTISIGQMVAALGITQFLVGPLTRLTYLVGVAAQARASASRIGAALTVPPAVRGGNRRLPAGLPPTASASGGTRARDEAAPATSPVHGQDVRRGHMPASGETLAAPSPVPGRGDTGHAADAGWTTAPRPSPAPPGVGLRQGLRFEALGHGPIRDVDLEISAGQLLGIVATEPADAAALVSCLDGTTEPDEGRVTVDGVPLVDLDLDEARRVVVVAHHDARLFEGTLGENLAAAAPPGTDADLTPILVAADADEVVDTVPGGLDASVTEGGRSLSGGQRQRVALARALAADPPVLVLHEPTTAVDAATEHRIAAGVRSLRAGDRTTVLVTTSPTLLAATDRVVLVEGGRIVTDGTHAGLAASDPRYRMVVLS